MPELFAKVVVTLAVEGMFTYRVPEEFVEKAKIGSRVLVEFGRQKNVVGFIVDIARSAEIESKQIKDVVAVLDDVPVLDEERLELAFFLSYRQMFPLGGVISSILPPLFPKPKPVLPSSKLVFLTPPKEFLQSPPNKLTQAQEAAWEKIKSAILLREQKRFLILGITGSGKTELYLRASGLCMELGRSAILLVPEIALTPQLEGRVASRLGAPAVLHSGVSDKKRADFFWEVYTGKKRVVLGARSAVFAPTQDTGLIVVDEEHEPSYKQEDGMRYHAREVAELRARKSQAVCIFGSATPSVETFYRAKRGELELLELPERIEKRPLPEIEIVSMAKEKEKPAAHSSLLSLPLIEGIERTISSGQQAILFLNRRGFAPFVVCAACGHVFRCDRCAVSMTYHKFGNSLLCHYCANSYPLPDFCPDCGKSEFEMLRVGTERLEIELKNLFGERVNVSRLDRDTATSRKAHTKILTAFARREIDILVGTQMVAKGHDFPEVTFIGVVLADISLNLPDFRAAERTFQLLTQVAGRAGRGKEKGRVIIQTYEPNHYAIQSAIKQDYYEFFEKEIENRRELNYPPFSNLGLIQLSTKDRRFARKAAYAIARHLDRKIAGRPDVEMLGPSPCPIAVIRERFRWQIMIKSKGDVVTWLKAATEAPIAKTPSDFRLELDSSPVDFM